MSDNKDDTTDQIFFKKENEYNTTEFLCYYNKDSLAYKCFYQTSKYIVVIILMYIMWFILYHIY
ncbi:hypothetical protein crov042 [Cafeteria roenbergensis virus]|uniref:Uncharacterized protein n=1 Tax=Cafeteria roenbergensis virus (strain BV-PW1) TaxID=693272 RepID=E3T4G2_CROVB|nr:hypothetical protein crov042 [Cafeteria roenbergensis virus BV-PW1]ADO67075.1 hypothetical protein crov042 [Cafeteria roenbergensis virus BV-PW1]